MFENFLKNKYKDLLASVDIEINGNRPWDIKIHNSDVYKSILFKGSLGFGESCMKGWFDCDRLDIFFDKIIKSRAMNSGMLKM